MRYDESSSSLELSTSDNAGHLMIDSAGNVNLGKGSATSTNYGTNFQIHDSGTSGASIHLTTSATGGSNSDGIHLVQQGDHFYHWLREDGDMVFATNAQIRFTLNKTPGFAEFNNSVGIQTTNIDSANLSNPVGAGHSLVGLYIGDGSMIFNNTLNREGGYYISTNTNALNAGPVSLGTTMTLDGTWVIV